MKFKHLLAAIFSAAIVFTSCDPGQKGPEQKDSAMVAVNPSSIDIPAEGGSANVTITTNCSWTAEPDADWLNISLKRGGASNSGAVAEVSAMKNSGAERTATITVSGANGNSTATGKVTVRQAAYSAPEAILTLPVSSLAVSMKGSTQTIKIKSTADWTATSNSDWITVSPGKGEGSASEQPVTITVAANSGDDRSGKVTFSAGTKTAVLTVTQTGSGNAKNVTIAEFISKPAGTDTWYRITGTITQICDNSSKAYGNFYIKDNTGEIFCYGLTANKSTTNDQTFHSIGLSEGDTLTMITLRSEYHGGAQAGGTPPAFYESHVKGTVPYRTYSDYLAHSAKTNWMELPATSESDGLDFLHYTMYLGSREVRSHSVYWDYTNRVAHWVAYPLTRELMGYGTRTDKWGIDPLLSRDKQPVLLKAFDSFNGIVPGRGHQLPSADRTNYEINIKTFYGTNMTPQISDLNGGVWADLENNVRVWAKRSATDTLYVVTGCVVKDSKDFVHDNDGKTVAVPTSYFKALLRLYNGQYNAIGFYLEHRNYVQKKTDKSIALSIDALEEKVGLDFFVNLPDDIEAKVEAADPTKDNWWWDNMNTD